MRAKEFHISDPIEELTKKLPSLRTLNYDTIDELMTKISKRHKISSHKLHDMFVDKYGETPDHWAKKIRQRNEEEEIDEAGFQYKRMKNIDVDYEKYKGNQIEIGSLIDLTKNFQKYNSVVGKILDIKPNGKVVIKIVSLNPDNNGSLNLDDVINIHKNYLKKSPTLKEDVTSDEDMEKINDFIKWSMEQLHMKKPYPEIKLSKDTEQAKKGHHTGVHSGDEIWVYIGNRNLIDIFRTIFHELVHHRQYQLNMIKDGDSYPGSPIEAMADMMAGKYIKIYGKQHREIFQ